MPQSYVRGGLRRESGASDVRVTLVRGPQDALVAEEIDEHVEQHLRVARRRDVGAQSLDGGGQRLGHGDSVARAGPGVASPGRASRRPRDRAAVRGTRAAVPRIV